jgi:hypothetical protein
MKFFRYLKTAGLAAIIGVSSLTSLAAPTDLRNRVELTQTPAGTVEKFTLGDSPADAGKYGEFFRAYCTESKTDDWFNPSWNIKEGNIDLTLFGETGKKDGFGVQTVYDIGNSIKPRVNFEHENNRGRISERKGFGIEKKIGSLTLYASFDNLSGPDRNIPRAWLIYDIDKHNTVGIDYAVNNGAQNGIVGKTHIIDGAWVSYGSDKAFGLRNYFRGTHTEGAKKDALEFDLLLAQNPKFGRVSGTGFIGSGVDKFYDTPAGTLKSPVSMTERTPLGERCRKGLAAQFDLIANRNNSLPTTGSVRFEAGYAVPLSHGNYLCPTVFAKKLLGSKSPSTTGISAQYHLGNLLLEANVDNRNGKYVSVQYTPRFGK